MGSISGSALAASPPATRGEFLKRLSAQELPFTPITPPATTDTLQVLVSLNRQIMQVYAGDRKIGSSSISTGKPGKETPHGIFSVISKHEFRWSNLYLREPMPFMQRLTWSGIALHAGELPGYPASHGCVRMPEMFAKQLFRLETADRHVVIAGDPVPPVMVSHASLPKSAGEPGEAKHAALSSEERDGETGKVTDTSAVAKPALRILLTRLTGREKMANAQKILNKLGFKAGRADGYVGRKTWRAIFEFQKSVGVEEPDGDLTDATYDLIRNAKGADQYPDGRLYVRQRQRPVFDVAIALKDPDKPLGNHLLTMPHLKQDGGPEWLSVSLDDKNPNAGLDAFLRFTLPDDVRSRIEDRLGPHSSIAISDAGLGRETGKGTDFVVVTHNPANH
jgi:hypothetical protein